MKRDRALVPQRLMPSTFFDRFFEDWPENVLSGWSRDDEIKVEEERKDNSIVVRADIPGVDPDKDIEITIEKGMLRIQAERQQRSVVNDKNMYRSEIRYGSFVRELPLPAGATQDDVKASYKDGVLEVEVPVSKQTEGKKVPITQH